MHLRLFRVGAIALMLGSLTACTLLAPKYTALPAHVNQLRDSALDTVKLGEFSAEKSDLQSLSIRGSSYISPYGSFALYVKESLRQELEDARVLSPNATLEISGVLVKNELNTGMATGDAHIETRFVVKRNGVVKYNKVKSASYQWSSSFVGAIAIPKAQENYPNVVQALLGELYADPDFITAMRK